MTVMTTQKQARPGRKTAPARRALRPTQDLVDMVIIDFPRSLKKALTRQAVKEKSNLTNVVVTFLAESYGVPFAPTDRGFGTKPGDSDKVSFAMPRALRHAIQVDAAQRDMTRRDVVIEALLERFGKK